MSDIKALQGTKELTQDELKAFATKTADMTPQERAAELQKLTIEKMGVKVDPHGHAENANLQVNLALTDNQLEQILEKSVGGAKAAVNAIAADAQLKYGYDSKKAKDAAERVVETHIKKNEDKATRNQITANIFADMYNASRNNPNKLEDSYKREMEYMAKKGHDVDSIIQQRAMTVGTAADGGYLAPELWVQDLYESLAKTSLARRMATQIEIRDAASIKIPTIDAAGLTASRVAELSAASVQQPTLGQKTIDPKKLVVMTKPFSHELIAKGRPEIVPILTHLATIAFGRKEDEAMIVGSDASFSGWLEQTANEIYLGGSSTSGSTAITDATFDDMADAENALAEQYVPDEDVENSGGIRGEARYFANKKLYNVLSKLKGNDDYYWKRVDEAKKRQIHGFRAHRSPDMPSAPAANTAFAVFGNPAYTYFGYHPGVFVEMLKEGTVDSVNLATTAGQVLRLIEYIDPVLIDANALTIIKTAAS